MSDRPDAIGTSAPGKTALLSPPAGDTMEQTFPELAGRGLNSGTGGDHRGGLHFERGGVGRRGLDVLTGEEALDVEGEGLGARVAPVRSFVQALHADIIEGGRNFGV